MKTLFIYLLEKKKTTWILFLLWTSIIFFGCFLPSDEIPNLNIPLIDKWVHFIFFAGYSFLALCLFKKPSNMQKTMIFLSSVLLGWIVELIQGSGLVRGRAFEWNDVLADGIGGLIGVLVYSLMSKWVIKK